MRKHRRFYVALGVPRGEDTNRIQVAYRNIVTGYREMLLASPEDREPLLRFSVLRTYSERRHAAVFEKTVPAVPPAEDEVDRFFGGFVPNVLGSRAAMRGKDLYVEMRLSPEEALSGGIFPVHIPVLKRCPLCSGEDEATCLACCRCGGTGRVTEDRLVDVTIPHAVQSGQMARLPMEDVGLNATDLIVRITISQARLP